MHSLATLWLDNDLTRVKRQFDKLFEETRGLMLMPQPSQQLYLFSRRMPLTCNRFNPSHPYSHCLISCSKYLFTRYFTPFFLTRPLVPHFYSFFPLQTNNLINRYPLLFFHRYKRDLDIELHWWQFHQSTSFSFGVLSLIVYACAARDLQNEIRL